MKLTTLLFSLTIVLAIISTLEAQDFQQGGSKITTTGAKNTQISLNGTWKFNQAPPASFWENTTKTNNWSDIKVPGECTLQGFKIEHDKEYPYKKQIDIPADYKDKRILLRFDGVYSFVRVWVNGHFIRSHSGGFTTWYCDITDFVKPGDKAWLTVGVTDRVDDISDASGYAFHLIGGFLRGVSMLALLKTHVNIFTIETDFDKAYQDAMLKVNITMNMDMSAKAKINFILIAPDGKMVNLPAAFMEILASKPSAQVDLKVKSPLKWNAEQPNLYTLEASVLVDNKMVQKISKKIGFRKIEVKVNKLLVNGSVVKFHGTCRHDAHPLYGRSTSNELDLQDVLLCKEANINFIRTSHYPPSEYFLEMCDKYGIYVEEETAVCFVGGGRESKIYSTYAKTENDTAYTSRYVNQFSEMIERDRDHPSVIIWSLGNESHYGINFQKEYEYVKRTDLTRPVIFSWPGTTKGNNPFDILSFHYPNTTGQGTAHVPVNRPTKDFRTDTIPVLNDEFGHLPCYIRSSLKFDQNIRNFWGEGLKRFWDGMYESDGALGGSIWCMTDDVFMLPDTTVGYGPWGFIDGWRRKKPEFWHLKKGYSPVKIDNETLLAGVKLQNISVTNRFDFTNLNTLKAIWRKGNERGNITLPDIAPHSKGTIQLPFNNLQNGDTVNIAFYKDTLLIDEYNLTAGKSLISFESNHNKGISLNDGKEQYGIMGKDFSLEINKQTGKITSGIYKGEKLITGGPYLFLGNRFPRGDNESLATSLNTDYRVLKESSWKFGSITAKTIADTVFVDVTGAYDTINIAYTIKISSDGLIRTSYKMDKMAKAANSLGLCFDVSGDFNKILWKRNGLWTAYPADHIGRLSGVALKTPVNDVEYRVKPLHSWSSDGKDFWLNGKNGNNPLLGLATIDFQSLKEHIYYYSLQHKVRGINLRVESDGKNIAVRSVTQVNGIIRLYLLNQWTYPELGMEQWGNYCGEFKPDFEKGYSITMRFVANSY